MSSVFFQGSGSPLMQHWLKGFDFDVDVKILSDLFTTRILFPGEDDSDDDDELLGAINVITW